MPGRGIDEIDIVGTGDYALADDQFQLLSIFLPRAIPRLRICLGIVQVIVADVDYMLPKKLRHSRISFRAIQASSIISNADAFERIE